MKKYNREYNIYEIGVPDHYDDSSNDCGVDCTIWIAVEKGISIRNNKLEKNNIYIKPIPYEITSGGIDFILEREENTTCQ